MSPQPRSDALLDVDGPLNPFAAKAHRRPPGYETFRQTKSGGWYTSKRKGLRVWLNPRHGVLLRALAEETGLTLVWATSWQHEANDYIGPVLGLPPLPVIEFTVRRDWKWPAVSDYAAGRPLAWFDDQFNRGQQNFEAERDGTPTLLCHVDPASGLRDKHFQEVRAWAKRLP
ncbi:hypothetical protein LWC34_26200 [Kibdelosporangium philippinense]|uniref:Uncharacterized protein n=1 Tax=Kibdelosporangium philippinense TaxID=211113 RepID=A0ABS8ZEV5_9PSEU|nr:HAD domain-containing protein [Kibdelosporangium philippinense]MCE7006305.1 hypothetical protein [Kibdelosporangium philippinense]